MELICVNYVMAMRWLYNADVSCQWHDADVMLIWCYLSFLKQWGGGKREYRNEVSSGSVGDRAGREWDS